MLKDRGWVPTYAKNEPSHEPRNGITMCGNHYAMFDHFDFFIRFVPDIGKFVFINFADHETLRPFHNKLIGLDPKDQHAPFPSLFIIHGMCVRGFNPFDIDRDLESEFLWQDWILTRNVLSNSGDNYFERSRPPQSSPPPLSLQFPSSTIMGGGGGGRLALNNDVIAEILAATRAMPSWKACQVDNTSWEGTGDENTKRYLDIMGSSDPEVA